MTETKAAKVIRVRPDTFLRIRRIVDSRRGLRLIDVADLLVDAFDSLTDRQRDKVLNGTGAKSKGKDARSA